MTFSGGQYYTFMSYSLWTAFLFELRHGCLLEESRGVEVVLRVGLLSNAGLRSFEIGCLDCESIHIQIPAPGSRQEDKS